MNYTLNLDVQLDELHLLKHPFYKAWNDGTLNIEVLKKYSQDYLNHVCAFPKYIVEIINLCKCEEAKKILFGNLAEEVDIPIDQLSTKITEEQYGPKNHPALWHNFTKGLGVTNEELKNNTMLNNTKDLVNGFLELTKLDYATGLGALYAYERQTPEVAKSKIDGLQKHYNIHDQETTEFFSVHMQADEWHRDELAGVINALTPNEQEKVKDGAIKAARLLWGFLDGMVQYTMQNVTYAQ